MKKNTTTPTATVNNIYTETKAKLGRELKYQELMSLYDDNYFTFVDAPKGYTISSDNKGSWFGKISDPNNQLSLMELRTFVKNLPFKDISAKGIKARLKSIPEKYHNEFPLDFLKYERYVPTVNIPSISDICTNYKIRTSDLPRYESLLEPVGKTKPENGYCYVEQSNPRTKKKDVFKLKISKLRELLTTLKAEYKEQGMVLRGGETWDAVSRMKELPVNKSIWNENAFKKYEKRFNELVIVK